MEIIEVNKKIPKLSGLVDKTDYDTKISEIEGKYFATTEHNKIASDILDVKIKQKELVNKSDISNLVANSDLKTKLTALAIKVELKAE